MPETFPFYLPGEVRRLYTSDAVARRVSLTAHWTNTARVLELHGSAAGIALAKELGCEVGLVESDEQLVKSLEHRVAAAGVSDRVKVTRAAPTSLTVPEGSLDGVLVLGRLLWPFEETATRLRKLLALRGRVAITWPVRVGLRPNKGAVELWEGRIGTQLLSPRETLGLLERQGFEPETIETPSEVELDDYYKSVEAALAKGGATDAAKGLRQEVDVHRDTAGRSGVTLALMVARRKEPGERPPAARDGG